MKIIFPTILNSPLLLTLVMLDIVIQLYSVKTVQTNSKPKLKSKKKTAYSKIFMGKFE